MNVPAKILLLALVALPAAAQAQSLDLTINNTGLSIGDSRFVRGVRLNFRDRRMERVVGINATIWAPYDDARGGVVQGLALGLPVTGASRIEGAGIGVFGVGAEDSFTGLGIGGFGVGAGGEVRGVLIGGFGVAAVVASPGSRSAVLAPGAAATSRESPSADSGRARAAT
jgi:hypothetical protein